MDWLTTYENNTELYTNAERRWPNRRSRPGGKWLLASFDDESIIVYQAYNNDIAQYACQNGHFIGCPGYNEQRMTWIKTNFLWMMYRSKWATRSNQQHILAIWLHRSAFDNYLARAVQCDAQNPISDRQTITTNDDNRIDSRGRVRLQWDPDHYPDGSPVLGRRAVQLGLRQIQSFLDGRDILRIIDVTPFVQRQYTNAALSKGRRRQLDQLYVPIENIYEPFDERIRQHVELDPWNPTNE